MDETTSSTKLDLASSCDVEEGYDPLAFIEGEDDEDWMDDDGLLLPNVLSSETPVPRRPMAVYSPERTGSVSQSVRDLVKTNAARRHILLSILDWARDGEPASVLFRRIDDAQVENRSVYEPVSYCRMLERAGALRLELAVSAEGGQVSPQAEEDPGAGIAYLSIEEEVDPVWRSTEEGLAVYEELIQGDEWREKVLGEDSKYAEVYLAVMSLMADGGKPKDELVDLAETFEVTKSPLRYGAYFIDVLEATSAIQWKNASWNLTDLGTKLLAELVAFCELGNTSKLLAEHTAQEVAG